MHIKNLPRRRGFSLVEVMVGMVMGVIVLLVIMKAFALAEGYKRTTTSGSDSQVNGLLALRTLEAEIRMAGYGITGTGAALCPSITQVYNGTVSTINSMPVKITGGVAATDSDKIEILYSSADGGASPTRITTAMPTPSNVTWVNTTSNLNVCDLFLYASPTGTKACSLAQVTGMPGGPAKVLTGSGQSNYNPPGGALPGLYPPGGYDLNDILINLGNFVNREYSITKTSGKDEFFLYQSNMRPQDTGCAVAPAPETAQDKVSNIVYMKAQYGVAPAGLQNVTCWTSAGTSDTGCAISAGNWSAPAAVDVKRIKAIRYVVVARSQLAEKKNSAGTCNTTTTAPISWANLGTGTPPVIDLSGTSTDWQCYRYRTFQTIVPMINVIWSNS